MQLHEGLQDAVLLTLKLAGLSTLLCLLAGIPLAWWLSQGRTRGRVLVSALVTLPLVLPPTVLGFYLLVIMGPLGPVGRITQLLGGGLLSFTFSGLLLGSVIFSLPFAVQPIQYAFESLGRRPLEVAWTLQLRPMETFFRVALPLARPGILTAAILCFAHTVGEFGVVLMIGGNIPGQTQVLSTQIYGYVEALDYGRAHALAAGLLVFSLSILVFLSWVRPRIPRII